jgi:two-component system response regulator AtoC
MEHLALRPRPGASAPIAGPSAPTPMPIAADASPPALSAASDLQAAERAMIEKALKDARYNKSVAAKALGLSRTQLYVRLRRYGLE